MRTLKETLVGLIPKARCFEEIELSELQKDSPTCSTVSSLVSVISQRQWTFHSMGIKSAFLQGTELSRDIFTRPPPEANCKGTLEGQNVRAVWQMPHCTGTTE